MIRVIELFAGVGGFRLGLEKADSNIFHTVWANQWEPSKKAQDAFACYAGHFQTGVDEYSNQDISQVPVEVFQQYKPDLVVGGFPCQDYSVARSLSGEKGLQGKKGVLFWDIKRVVESTKPKYVLLENVDRLLKSPSKQRGRDFGVMLATFRDLGYTVEWRVINAAEYGHAQRRRRTFIFAYKHDTPYEKMMRELPLKELVYQSGFFAEAFPVKDVPVKNREADTELTSEDIVEISDQFSFNFFPAGIMRDGQIYTTHPEPVECEPTPLGSLLQNEETVEEKYYLTSEMAAKFEYLRGAKKIERTAANGHQYIFSEGGMSPTDDLKLPGRTMLTSEGSVNRSTHIVEVNGRKRFLTPLECERLNEFEDNWTMGMSERMRYFCMGNALVVGLIKTMGKHIIAIDKTNKNNEMEEQDASAQQAV